MNVKRRGAVQVNRALRGEATFGFAVRGTKRDGKGKGGRPSGENKVECGEGRQMKKHKTKERKRKGKGRKKRKLLTIVKPSSFRKYIKIHLKLLTVTTNDVC